ncbi:hypothetical protein B0H14DRAFT_2627337 [Mycena olivaceomarginata]|nr:hypothetical protein B0H14DRAFT_2627337 [Mycena olivaceomarginata]
MPPFFGLKVSTKPVFEWHAFATIPDDDGSGPKGFSVVVSAAGDWTCSKILLSSQPGAVSARGQTRNSAELSGHRTGRVQEEEVQQWGGCGTGMHTSMAGGDVVTGGTPVTGCGGKEGAGTRRGCAGEMDAGRDRQGNGMRLHAWEKAGYMWQRDAREASQVLSASISSPGVGDRHFSPSTPTKKLYRPRSEVLYVLSTNLKTYSLLSSHLPPAQAGSPPPKT